MRASVWKMSVLILAVAVVATGQSLKPMTTRTAPMSVPAGVKDEAVTTTRDAQGVWFIEGGSLYGVFEAMGYAVAVDRLWQMDIYRRQGNGRLSELLGPSLLSTDVFLRTLSYSAEELDAQFAALSPDAQTAYQAYTDGINRRIGEFYAGNWRAMPFEYWILGFKSVLSDHLGPVIPTPWTVHDVMGWVVTLARNFDPEGSPGRLGQLDNYALIQTLAAVYPTEYGAMFTDLRWLNDPTALTYIQPSAKAAREKSLSHPSLKLDAYPDFAAAVADLRDRTDELDRQLEAIGAKVKMGSYAWAISGDKTASGNPILYSGPQMGFELPSITVEGSVRGGGLEVSGMTVPGVPGIIIGRTPHHTWSMQVGHAHTMDYYLEALQSVSLHRMETIKIHGAPDVTLPIFRSPHGPIISPMPFNPATTGPIISWASAHWNKETTMVDALLMAARAQSMDDFDEVIELAAVSQHFTYIDVDGNIAYWMAGWDPVRAPGVDPRLPSIGNGSMEWTGARRPRVHDRNTAKGWYGGWNNKASADYLGSFQNYGYTFGTAHRAHVIDDYLSTHDNLTFEEIRDLALNIATTDSFGAGGNTWSFVADTFTAAVAADPDDDRNAAIAMLDAWDGHFVAGGPSQWRFGAFRADAWVLQDAWIKEMIRLTFEDEFVMMGMDLSRQPTHILFNVLLHGLNPAAGLPTYYNWFQDKTGSGTKPTTPEGLIVMALDNVIATMGLGPYNAPRGNIVFGHQVLSQVNPAFGAIHSIPFSSRSTYAHCVEFDSNGPARIESMFPLGESGQVNFTGYFTPTFDRNFFSMAPAFDPFLPRPFPLFN